MFFKLCQNFMDITNNVESAEKKQTGGDGEPLDVSASSSDFEVSETVSDVSIDKFIGIKNIDELIKDQAFNKLTNEEKTLVINKFNEQSKELGKISKSTDSVVSKECYFYCKTCGYYEVIPDRMFIFSRGDEKKDDIYNTNFINNKNDPTLPNTKKYTCINDKCATHKDPKMKNAVFYRQKGSYTTRYICTICDSFWNTFIEK